MVLMISQRMWVETQPWFLITVMMVMMVVEVMALSGTNVCMVKQKYNITKRIKYRAPMSVRTYEWCFSMPPRCSRWNTEMRDLTRLETEERTAEVAVCCPGYKMKDVSCVPICPNGKTGSGCSEDCPPNRWGPNCIKECKHCSHGVCSPITGECNCQEGWQGESCEIIITTSTTSTTPVENLLTTKYASTKTTRPSSTEATLITTLKNIVPVTIPSMSTMATTPFHISTAITETTSRRVTPLTRISHNNFSLSTSPMTTLNFSSNYKDIFSTPVERPTLLKTKEIVDLKSTNIINNSTTEPVQTIKGTYMTIKTTGITTTKIDMSSEIDKKVQIPVTETRIVDEPTSRTFEVTKRLPPKTTPKMESTRKPDTTIKAFPTTLKFKPKEIWIRPAQKGEAPVTETKIKINHDTTNIKYKNATKVEIVPNTTPKTIIVSIIPTSVSYATFKKLALTTASYLSLKNHTFVKTNKPGEEFTKAMSIQTSTATPITKNQAKTNLNHVILTSTPSVVNVSKSPSHSTFSTTRRTSTTVYVFVTNRTNSMSRTSNVGTKKMNTFNPFTMATVSMTNFTSFTHRRNAVTEKLTTKTTNIPKYLEPSTLITTEHTIKTSANKNLLITKRNATKLKTDRTDATKFKNILPNINNNTVNVTNNSETNTVTTDQPEEDEEKFHILTEPEHITAVMSDKAAERSSVDLISVISIAGGVMMAVITVAVVIVMMERCRRPRYDDIRKINDIRMQVMIDNNDMPPPYVRSIFHTPLPDPPSEKCHYQPISTLDRNLKQFMRPVVVQTISPIMLENFRGILECHYDHLPHRSHDFETTQKRNSKAPSIEVTEQHHLQRVSLTESAIDALKCEAKLDVIDSTTSEPLYAEIPCWRPPSEHAVEIMNVNGEAVTEL
ncbi:unnamed protein product [Diatraea saccharalis]|uniref:EMI domain-containing protein n=1 Tax=Diatraea saccharalis TaxID=40085 RepID=A0A9N9RET9_9NEOP|nr:unnamed protein product [Diatraea saccharalis]